MGDRLETLPSSEPLDLESTLSRIRDLSEIQRSCNDVSDFSSSESEKLLKDCIAHFESRVKQITPDISDFRSLGSEDLDAYIDNAKKELNLVQAENLKISDEIEVLTGTYIEDYPRLEKDLEELNYSLKFVESQGIDELQMGSRVECSLSTEHRGSSMNVHEDYNFEVWDLDNQIEKTKVTLSSLQDIDDVTKRVEAIGQIQDMLSGLKVIEFEGNCIRLSVKTFIPTLEGLLYHQNMEYATEPLVVDHELLIELMDGTLELRNVEIFPNDVFIGEVVDAAKSLRYVSLLLSFILRTRSSLAWFVGKVQTRIILCNLRRLLVKDASISRYSFEYSDKDETIIAHVAGGINAFIKIPQSWPIANSALKLISLVSSDNHSKGISLSFLCKVQELANSLDVQRRQNLSNFSDAIDEILVQQMCSELQSDSTAHDHEHRKSSYSPTPAKYGINGWYMSSWAS
ncbi:hypothetical protein BVC80_8097g5 [Macleaya cordata]|uniref:Uncharacterized protein n=1 Tax=Macleaya cordata TaxID=56857 RepID=A0A200Q014_MACCD|nr:hypothetical protein BVC80_8097g5 [Macleaya cordata]